MAVGLHPVTFINTLCSKSVLLCLDAWNTFFNCPTVQECYFLTFRGKNCKPLYPSYSKDSSLLLHIGQVITLCARAAGAILVHAFIGEYRQHFFPTECTQYSYSYCQVGKCQHIFTNYSRFAHSPLINPSSSIKDLSTFWRSIQEPLPFFSRTTSFFFWAFISTQIICFSVSVDSFLSFISLSFFWLCILSIIGLFVDLDT